jgi:prolyl oligopeptidase
MIQFLHNNYVHFGYSPLHNLAMPTSGQIPAMLIMTADHDDRVVPLHSLKYIAQLYHVVQTHEQQQTNPLLIRVEVKAGHGSGKPTSKIVSSISACNSYQ